MYVSNLILQVPANGGMINIVVIIAIVAICYFFMIRPQTKRQKEIKKFREALKPGDKIITAGGIYGRIKEVREDSFIVSVSESVTIRISKDSVYQNAGDSQQNQQK